MPSTQYTDATFGVREIAARTDAAGVGVDDLPLDEDRIVNHILTEGYLTAGAFQVAADSPASMDVLVGSGTARADLFVVEGDDDGQHPYIVRLDDVTVTVTLDAADVSNPRLDEVWLVVADATYDGGSVSLPRIAVRKGDPAGSPSAPGPDAAWKAAVKLATITVGSAVSSITSGNIADNRPTCTLAAVLQGAIDHGALAGLGDFTTDHGAGHDSHDHSAALATASLADLGTANGADLDDLGTFAAKLEVDGHDEVSGSAALSGSYSTVASLALNIPASWGSWKCFVTASWATSGGSSDQYNAKVTIDGTDDLELSSIESGNAAWRPGAIVARRTGIATTGNRTIALKMREPVGTGTSVRQIVLYARAVRTS